MYEDHPSFQQPDDPDTRIWRYMDFAKFVSLLDRNAVFFVKSALLEDPYEGAIPQRTFEEWARLFPEDPKLEDIRKTLGTLAISCWHVNSYESAAMWQMHIRGSDGIAITSTFQRLADSLHQSTRPQYIGKVRYIDYDRDKIRELRCNTFNFITYKRRSFEFEQELRAAVSSVALLDPQQQDSLGVTKQQIEQEHRYNDQFTESGIYVPIDVNVLIDDVYVSPTAQPWFVELVESITKKYDLRRIPCQSSLADDPVY